MAKQYSTEQRQLMLDRWHRAKADGLTQEQIAKEFNITRNAFSLVLRKAKKNGMQPTDQIPTISLKTRKPYTKRAKAQLINDDFVCVAYGPKTLVERLLNLRGQNA